MGDTGKGRETLALREIESGLLERLEAIVGELTDRSDRSLEIDGPSRSIVTSEHTAVRVVLE